MAKAIKITQEIKDKNYRYKLAFVKNNAIGAIVKTSIPNQFFVSEPVSGGYASRTDLHDADGWKTPVIPVEYDEAIHNLGSLIEVGNDFVYQLINKTQEEQDAYIQTQEDNDEASNFFNQRMRDGEDNLMRFNSYVYRQAVNGDITKEQAIAALEFFYDALHPLKMGYFELAKTKVTALSGGAQITTLKNKILTNIQNYLDNE